MDEVVAHDHIAAGAPGVLTGHFDADIHVMHQVAFNQDTCTAVHIDAIGGVLVPVGWIAERADVVDGVAADHAITGLVEGRIGSDAFKTNRADGDVVGVMHAVVADDPVLDVAIQRKRFAATQGEMVDLIAVDEKLVD